MPLLRLKPALLGATGGTGRPPEFGPAVETLQAFGKPFEGDLAVARLGTGVGGQHHHARWQVRQAHGGFGLVQVLAAGAAGAEGIEAHLPRQRRARQVVRRP